LTNSLRAFWRGEKGVGEKTIPSDPKKARKEGNSDEINSVYMTRKSPYTKER